MALVKYNNNSISAVTSAASIPSGALTLIKTLTASSSATLSFVDGADSVVLDSTYPIYVFKFINIHPSTGDRQLVFQGNVAGAGGYNETITSTSFRAYHNEAGSASGLEYRGADDQAQGTDFQKLSDTVKTDNDASVSGELTLFNPSSTTFVKHFIAKTNAYNQDVYSMNTFAAGYFNVTSAIDEIQFKMRTGNMDSGKIKLYGIKDS